MKHEEGCVDLYDELGGICICQHLRKAYREGYSDHARAAQHWQDTHGAYRQHGEGENP